MNNMTGEFATVSGKEAMEQDEILDLADAVNTDFSDKQTTMALNNAVDDEEIIDLAVMSEPVLPDHEDTIDLVDTLDDDVVDLSDIAVTADHLDADEELLETAMSLDDDEEVLDLSEEALPLFKDDGILDLDDRYPDRDDDSVNMDGMFDENRGTAEDILELGDADKTENVLEMGTAGKMETSERVVNPDVNPAENSIEILPEQLEAALERLISHKFADKMDALVVKVIEEKVNREVARVKALLLNSSFPDA